ncbi:MAG TPA: efflux RND transporter periplasmic adaptor subunit [Gemmatimonadales bacterium]|nr:efflux RND transporter periplasmic adaptor subunit [Gemmatimonadales bacterium]
MTTPVESAEGTPPAAGPARDAQLARLRRIRQLSVALFETLNQTAVVEAAIKGAMDLLGADGGSFWASSDKGFVCQLARGIGQEKLSGAQLPEEKLLAADSRGSVLAVPVTIGGSIVGALRLTRGTVDAAPPFEPRDREALEDLTDSLGAALYAAVRAESAQHNEGLALVLEMSREIGSSLDLDRMLRTTVNLATRAVEFDRGAVALYEAGHCDIRALAGVDKVDVKTPEMMDLAARAAWAVGVGEQFYLSDRTEPGSDAERIFVQIFGEDLAAAGVGSGLYLPLRDEEGAVGILLFEAERADFATDEQRELVTILANQTTVAIRNAQLYARVPMAGTLTAFAEKRQQLFAIPRRKRLLAATMAVLLLAALTLIQWPFRVPAIQPAFQPMSRVEVRGLIPGIVEQVLVREGTAIEQGMPIARLRDTEARAERDALVAAVTAAERSAALAASRRDPAQERLQRLRAESFRRELAIHEESLALLVLRSPVSGIVLSARPEEQVGKLLDAGETFALIGRTDSLELEFGVNQQEVDRVAAGAEVRLRVDAYPQRTFIGHVSAVGMVAGGEGRDAVFPVRAVVANDQGALRPGMPAQARVLTEPMSALGRMIRTPVRMLRLFWWRAWSWA